MIKQRQYLFKGEWKKSFHTDRGGGSGQDKFPFVSPFKKWPPLQIWTKYFVLTSETNLKTKKNQL